MAEGKSYRFHVLAVPHTVSSKEYLSCAYTQKVVKFCQMMTSRGHQVLHYGHESSDVLCTEHVTVLSSATFDRVYGGYDWRGTYFKYDEDDDAYREFRERAVAEIRARKRPLDFVLAFWGCAHKAVCDAVGDDVIVVEPGIGYWPNAAFARWRVYESYALLHASCRPEDRDAMNWYHAVVPNYFDVTDFRPDVKDDYFLYVGRLTECKGIKTAVLATQEIGARLVIAGQGARDPEWPAHVEFAGFVDVESRRRLMARAKGAFVMTHYLEPFGGVAIEHMLSGTPVITSDWGAFAETVQHGVTGYRCRTFDHVVWAARNVHNISSQACRDWAVANFSLYKVGGMYEEYFQSVHDVYTGAGWYQRRDDREQLDWLRKDGVYT